MATLKIEMYVAGEMQMLHIKINTLHHKFNTLDSITGNENDVTYENSCRSCRNSSTNCCRLTSTFSVSGLAAQVTWGHQNSQWSKKNERVFVWVEGINHSSVLRCQFSSHSPLLHFLGSSLCSTPQFREQIPLSKSDMIQSHQSQISLNAFPLSLSHAWELTHALVCSWWRYNSAISTRYHLQQLPNSLSHKWSDIPGSYFFGHRLFL